MEWLSDFAHRLLSELTKAGTYVSAKELSELLGASPKTIYRTVREINETSSVGEVVSSRRGVGYRVEAADVFSSVREPAVLTPVARRREILAVLLRAAPDRLDFELLSTRFFISESLLRADLRSTGKKIMDFGLSLRREHWKIWVEGTEVNIRQALSSLVDSTAVETMYVDPGFVENRFEESDLAFARQQVEVVEQRLGTTLLNPYDINLASHIYVRVTRSRRHENAVTPSINLAENSRDEKAWQVALYIVENAQRYLGVGALAEEIPYIYAHLVSSRKEHAATEVVTADDSAVVAANTLADSMTHTTGIDFSPLLLRNDLARHVRPLLNRLRYGIAISNPVVAQARAEYLDIFEALEHCVQGVSALSFPRMRSAFSRFTLLGKSRAYLVRCESWWVVLQISAPLSCYG
ncbi:BglG family transcription antiterminator [Corynebacterium cystitidis]|uniref:BglG family transcription antiterminator n=1 Tax=Corynebacterium cystitidis TaxID=35757 RepID=UPI001472F07F|nr:HTH domain-containing protein [Corynebacterium cystitidis]